MLEAAWVWRSLKGSAPDNCPDSTAWQLELIVSMALYRQDIYHTESTVRTWLPEAALPAGANKRLTKKLEKLENDKSTGGFEKLPYTPGNLEGHTQVSGKI